MPIKPKSLSLPKKQVLDINFDRKIKSLSVKKTSYSSYVESSNEFIFFGCWNNINCSDDIIHRNIVLELLKLSNLGKPIVLAGDNWYNQKIPKKTTGDRKTGKKDVEKYYSTYVLKTGYELLFEASKNVAIVLGNHDITEDSLELPTNSPKTNTLRNLHSFCEKLGCKVKVQAFIIENILQDYPVRFDFFTNSYINSNIRNNTNIRNNNIDVITNNNVSLYTCIPHIGMKTSGIYFLYLNTNVFESDPDTIDKYRETVNRKLEEIEEIEEKINLLFIVGHHPFAGLKDKNGLSVKNVSELYFKSVKKVKKVEAIYKFLDIFVKYKSIYLCADIHNFQICKLHSEKLHSEMCMVICGSGGANRDLIGDYDDSKFPSEVALTDSENKYLVKDLYVHNAYGFCNISYSAKGNKVKVQYYKIVDDKIVNNKINYNIFTYTLRYKTSTKSWNITKNISSIVKCKETTEQFISSEHCKKMELDIDKYRNNCEKND
tara:strand:- start:498 stop:1964 length:1467 start_codon:yes stop_codon:yes gene_type:complete